MRKVSWWIEWPVGLIRVGVVFLVGATAATALIGYPDVLRGRAEAAMQANDVSYADREIAGGNDVVEDQQAAYQARALIPVDSTYRVEVGEDYQGDSDLTAEYVDDYFTYFLMPRRPDPEASWIICYGCDLARYGDDAEVVWRSDEDISLVRLSG